MVVDGRTPGRTQGLLLMLISCLPVLGSVLLAPILPAMQDHFEGTPGADALVPVTLTVPALMVGLLAPFAGRFVDRFGRKRLLVIALVVYALFGTAPLWLDALPAIVATRAGVGITEAAIMTCCTTLIADYFSGRERDRWLGLQTVFTAVGATVFFAAGGALGAAGWQTPFWLYSVGAVFAALAAVLLLKTAPSTAVGGPQERVTLPPIPWDVLRVPVIFTLVGGVVFYTPIVELPYALDDLGVEATAAIGGIAAIASAGTAFGAFMFGRVAPRGTAVLLPVAAGLAGIGIVIIGVSPAVPLTAVGAVIGSAGTGLMLPTLLTWAISTLPFEQRGRGTGLWTSAFFIGQFFCPLIVVALTAILGGLGGALVVVGVAALVMAGAARAVLARPASAIA
ncbi:UNVERIFIED_CONTAM: MFS transporter [Mumia flava]